jgi:predicted Zn-dependent protease
MTVVNRRGFLATLGALVAGGTAASFGDPEHGVSFAAVLETWADVLRDADQFGFRLTRVTDAEEMALGRELAGRIGGWWRRDRDWTPYVQAVGASLVPRAHRPGIGYTFHAIESGVVNAFALPGGQVFVFTGMLGFLRSEAELAAILGHEMAHVDLRHCIERYQYELTLRKVGAGQVGQAAEALRGLLTVGYRQYQELEADAHGVRMTAEAGYDPAAGPAMFRRLAARTGERTAPGPRTPVEEAGQAMTRAMGSYFRSHPPSTERGRRLDRLVARAYRQAAGRPLYDGVENYRQRVPRRQREFPGETRVAGVAVR